MSKQLYLALSAFTLELQGKKKKVAWFTDNTLEWSASTVHVGSKITELQSLTLSVFNVCVEPSILTITCTMYDDVFGMLDLIVNGDPTQWTGLPAAITPRFRVSFLGFTSLARKL